MVLVYMWYCVHDIHVVLRACGTMYVHYVVMVLGHVYSLCCIMCMDMCCVIHQV